MYSFTLTCLRPRLPPFPQSVNPDEIERGKETAKKPQKRKPRAKGKEKPPAEDLAILGELEKATEGVRCNAAKVTH